MSALAKIQHDFRDFVLGHGPQNFLRHVKPTGHPREALLDIYYNNVFSTHFRSLANRYPLVLSVVGQTMGRAMALGYIEAGFPCTGSLEDWGGGFISFIQSYEPASIWPYLGDLARYEWAKHIAYCAAEAPLLTPADMSELTVQGQEGPHFHFQKSCQLMAFSHSLEPMVAYCQKSGNLPPSDSETGGACGKSSQEPFQGCREGPSYALILKHEGIIKVHWLTPALFAFLDRLKEGQDMEVAYAAARVLEPEFNAQKAFCFLLSNPILRR